MSRRYKFEDWDKKFYKYGFCLIEKESLNENSLVIDVGAHRGYFSEDIMKKFDSFVIAIEPTSIFVDDLYKLQKKYPKLVVVDKALWKDERDIILYNYGTVANSLISRTFARKRRVVKERIKTSTLDMIIGDREVDYLKINTEGSEIEILQGASDETIRRCKYICVQYHNWLSRKMSKPITIEEVAKSMLRIKHLGFSVSQYDRHPNAYFERI